VNFAGGEGWLLRAGRRTGRILRLKRDCRQIQEEGE
jgi:hypothetical protein